MILQSSHAYFPAITRRNKWFSIAFDFWCLANGAAGLAAKGLWAEPKVLPHSPSEDYGLRGVMMSCARLAMMSCRLEPEVLMTSCSVTSPLIDPPSLRSGGSRNRLLTKNYH